ncbi:LPXTG cell wall anchor domain-containing protein, partial [Alkalihalobacillus hemicellulosilyticus]
DPGTEDELPSTSLGLYNYLIFGATLLLVGSLLVHSRKRKVDME